MSTSNTEGEVCNDDAEGKMILGKVDTKTYFVCDGGAWREATTDEEQAGEACTAKTNGTFNFDSTRVCNNTRFRASHVCDFELGARDYFNPDVEYGELIDNRDGRKYKTVTIGDQVWMAENLNYAREDLNGYLIGNNWCYNNVCNN